jgi:hypothetical protein
MGFHWTRCNPLAGALAPIAVLIVCATVAPKLPAIIRVVMSGLEWCCFFLACGMVAMAIIYKVLDRVLAPRHIIWIQGQHDYIGYVEAPHDESYSQIDDDRNGPESRVVLDRGNVPVLLGSSYERKETRQLQLSKRRIKR